MAKTGENSRVVKRYESLAANQLCLTTDKQSSATLSSNGRATTHTAFSALEIYRSSGKP